MTESPLPPCMTRQRHGLAEVLRLRVPREAGGPYGPLAGYPPFSIRNGGPLTFLRWQSVTSARQGGEKRQRMRIKHYYDGWLALPPIIRRQLGLGTNSVLEAELVDGAVVLQPVETAHKVDVAGPESETAATPDPISPSSTSDSVEPMQMAQQGREGEVQPAAPDGDGAGAKHQPFCRQRSPRRPGRRKSRCCARNRPANPSCSARKRHPNRSPCSPGQRRVIPDPSERSRK